MAGRREIVWDGMNTGTAAALELTSRLFVSREAMSKRLMEIGRLWRENVWFLRFAVRLGLVAFSRDG